MGHAHIPQRYAPLINEFCIKHLNPFLNFHRPCAFATAEVDTKGKIRKKYYADDYSVPVDKLLAIPDVTKYLKAGGDYNRIKET
jgi:hypothetical protein